MCDYFFIFSYNTLELGLFKHLFLFYMEHILLQFIFSFLKESSVLRNNLFSLSCSDARTYMGESSKNAVYSLFLNED